MKSPASSLVLNLPPRGGYWRHIVRHSLNSAAFLVIAAVAIPACLGYRINWQARSIEQTGLIELGGPQERLTSRIFVNDKLQEGTLPFRLNWAFGGTYDLRVERDGYQTWEKRVEVRPNMRVVYRSILLLYVTPKPTDAPAGVTATELRGVRPNSKNIQVRNGNELRIDDEYVTSTSKDIVDARWYPDGDHVAYQAGTDLIMYDVSAKTTQHVIAFDTENAVPYEFENGGRTLVYADGDTVKAVELYEDTSFIGRLGVAHSSSKQ